MNHADSIIRAGLLAAALASCSCGGKKEPEALPPRPAVVHQVEAPTDQIVRTFSGVTAASGSVQFGFEVGGRIIELKANSGQRYTKGDELARIDTAALEQEANRLEADAQRIAQDLARVQQLYENGNASKGDLDTAIAARRSSQAALINAQRKVANGILRMPYEGIVGEVLADEQDIVSAGTPVVLVQGEGPIEFTIGVPAELIGQIKLGQEGVLMLTTGKTHRLNAVVSKIVPRAMGNSTYPVTLQVQSSEEAELIDGMDGEMALRFANPAGEVMQVPAVCVLSGADGQRYVWRLEEDNTVSRQVVRTGELRAGGMIEILEGLESGATIVSRGAQAMEPGLEVRPQGADSL